MAKIKDIKDQNPEYVIDIIELLASKDPSKTNKYLPFMVKRTKEFMTWLRNELENVSFKEMTDIVNQFHDLSERNLLDNKDIYSYETNQEIVDAVKEASEKVTRGEIKKKETVVLHEDDRWLVIQPLTSRSSNVYGKSTKWCVSSEDHNFKKYYKDYTKDGCLVFLIDKLVKESNTRDNKLSKVAFHKYCNKDNKLTIWDSKDVQLDVTEFMNLISLVPGDVMSVINKAVDGKSNESIAIAKGINSNILN